MFTKSGENMRFFGEFFVKEGEGGTIFIYLVNEEGNTAYLPENRRFSAKFSRKSGENMRFSAKFSRKGGGGAFITSSNYFK